MMAPLRLLPVLLLAACQMGGEGLADAAPDAATVRRAAAPAAARNAPPDTAAGLIGADAEAVIRLFGAPRRRRSEGSAEIWLYAGPGCHLDIVFYPGDNGGVPRVAHAGARLEGAAQRREAECLAGIARRRA
jgi:hypothetical protein